MWVRKPKPYPSKDVINPPRDQQHATRNMPRPYKKRSWQYRLVIRNNRGMVAVDTLAKAFGIEVEKLNLLAVHGFMRIARAGMHAKQTMVFRDPNGAIHWPLIQLKKVTGKLGVKLPEIKRICKEHKIGIVHDSALGDCLTPVAFRDMLQWLQVENHPQQVDRASLLMWLSGLESPDPRRAPKYSKVMEKEIRRISKLPMVQRAEQSLLVYIRYREVAEIVKAMEMFMDARTKEERDRRIRWMENRLGQSGRMNQGRLRFQDEHKSRQNLNPTV